MKLSKSFCKLKEELLSCDSTVCFVWLNRGDQPTSNLSVLFIFMFQNVIFASTAMVKSSLCFLLAVSWTLCVKEVHPIVTVTNTTWDPEKKCPHDRNANRETLFSKCFLLAHMELQSEILTCNLLHGCLLISCRHESKLPLYVDNEIADHRATTSASVWSFQTRVRSQLTLLERSQFHLQEIWFLALKYTNHVVIPLFAQKIN